MKEILKRLLEYQTLSQDEARTILVNISNEVYNSAEVAAFMTIFMMRIITVAELQGFRNALYEQCVKLDFSDFNTVDLCGTGGDGKDTFNISTLSAFVVAGAGYHVAKHGNYGLSSICGSSNVLEYLGYQFTKDEALLKQQLEESGICFLHAPLFHPAMKAVAPIRKDLGIRTFFNLLGPLLNPSAPKHQLVGVYNLAMARHYSYIYQNMGTRFSIVHALDGYDEISLTGLVKRIDNSGERLLSPQDMGFEIVKPEEIKGGATIEAAAHIFLNVLNGKGTPSQNNVVVANAAQAIQCLNANQSEDFCRAEAKESLLGLKAKNALNVLLKKRKP